MNAGDRVRVERAAQTYEGVLLPSSTPDHLVVKLDGGYNVGIAREGADVDVLETDVYDIEERTGRRTSEIEFDDDLPTISLISTGGTIASTVDYRTGAVTAQFDAEDVLRAVPDLAGRANYRGRVVANILSENMTTDVWVDLAEAVAEEIEAGADGVVVMHGTDTMQFSASAMSFMLDTPVPIVFTGSQRSADRPSSDNVMNAVCAVEAAKADAAEVMVCMHAAESDDRCALHRGRASGRTTPRAGTPSRPSARSRSARSTTTSTARARHVPPRVHRPGRRRPRAARRHRVGRGTREVHAGDGPRGARLPRRESRRRHRRDGPRPRPHRPGSGPSRNWTSRWS